ncbi:hypothetical protein PAPYR_5794 [Paratrimastix pyriformis]|uniref:Uncharacterized protein n=1 Tax=Paratrimastix pyriformis TaxID=342808 RepID=A0ABQ8UGM6_9EUKA|nr:hypothetical protein PAPYR_5794 [Paratrimastix pyriformis]
MLFFFDYSFTCPCFLFSRWSLGVLCERRATIGITWYVDESNRLPPPTLTLQSPDHPPRRPFGSTGFRHRASLLMRAPFLDGTRFAMPAAAAACVPPHARSPSAIWLPTTLTPQLPAQWRLDVMTLNCTMLSHLTAQEQTDAGSLVDGKNDVLLHSSWLIAGFLYVRPGVQFPELLLAFFAEEQPCRGTPWESWLKIFSNFFFPKNFIKTLED